jgi:hypothetical protein
MENPMKKTILAAVAISAGLALTGPANAAGDYKMADRIAETGAKKRTAVAGFVQRAKRKTQGLVNNGVTIGYSEQLRRSGLYELGGSNNR